MFRFLIFAAIFFPLCVLAYTSVVADPDNAASVLIIHEAAVPQEFFGRLHDYPHTFNFTIMEPIDFAARIFVHDTKNQKNDVSIILVQHEQRGVSEVGRTSVKDASWESGRDYVFAESFKDGGAIDATLEAGSYTLEVSAPNNDGAYRLVLGDGHAIDRGYVERVRALFEAKRALGSSPFSALFSPLLYIPLLLLMVPLGFFAYTRWITFKNS